MVYQDYELIMTKRVNHDRKAVNPYKRRVFLAGGSYYPFYYAAVAGAGSWQYLKHVQKPVAWCLLPAFCAWGIANNLFGDMTEAKKLAVNQYQYQTELINYKKELFYD